MGECPGDPPAVAAIELNGCRVRLNDAKPQCFMTASGYFSFPLSKQTLANSTSASVAKHP